MSVVIGAVLSTLLVNGNIIDHKLTLMTTMKECEFIGKDFISEYNVLDQRFDLYASYKCLEVKDTD